MFNTACITFENISQYLNDVNHDITILYWQAGELNESVINNFPNLLEFHCNAIGITTLKPLKKCTKLRKLICNANKIKSLNPISNCIDLQYLSFYKNQVTTIAPISKCVNLIELNCGSNQICSLEPLEKCLELKKLNCCINKISSIDPITNCINLHTLECYANRITSLGLISRCVNLHVLTCSANYITSIEPLSDCFNLRMLWCNKNEITSLDPIIYLKKLRKIVYHDNPLENVTQQIQRMLYQINMKNTIYEDNQNIHDVGVQRCVSESVQRLLHNTDPNFNFTIDDVINSELSTDTKNSICTFFEDSSIHMHHLITYKELFICVWQRIVKSIYREEMMKILEEQIADSKGMCFTGRFNRTLSVLVGFYDDIYIEISDTNRISAIILNIRDRLRPYDVDKHVKLSKTALLEAGYSQQEIEPWIDSIMDV